MEKQTVDISKIAAAVARELTPKNGPAPVIRIGDGEALGAINGSVDIAIIIGGTTYTLTVQTPSSENNQEYVFTLTMQPKEGTKTTIGGFKFKDSSDWSVTIGLPKIEIGGVTIEKFEVSLGQGTV
jgi:hypothetical protein